MRTDADIVTFTFAFNILVILVFSLIYYSISPHNFEPLKPRDKLTYLDYLFYAVTIQSGIGLPDVTALTDLAKILAMAQQLILMGSAFILIRLFFERKK
jgi:hypothetical protein